MNPKVARDVLPLVSNPDFAELIGIYYGRKDLRTIQDYGAVCRYARYLSSTRGCVNPKTA
jgi:hypothetical protein